MVVTPLGWMVPLIINPIYSLYHVGMCWVCPLLNGSLGGLNSEEFSPIPVAGIGGRVDPTYSRPYAMDLFFWGKNGRYPPVN